MPERELAIVIRAKDFASRGIRGVKKELGGLSGVAKTAGQGISKAGHNLERMALIAGGAAVAGIGASVKMAMDFEAQLNTINTVAKATPEALGRIGESVRQLARDTGTPLEDLTAAYYDLVSAGIKTADAQDVLVASNTLAIGGLATTAEAVDLLTTAINSYGGDASKASQYADQFAQAIAAGKVTASEIAASFAQVGPLAASMGVGVDEISASLAQMTAKGAPAAEAMTYMKAAMIALQRQTPEMKRVLKELHIADATQYADKNGLVTLYDKLRKKADELGIPLIKLTGRVEGTQFALMNTGDELESFNKNLDDVRNSSGEAAEQMGIRQQGLAYQLARLKANVSDAAITIGSALLPAMGDLAEQGTGWITTHQEDIKRFAEDLASGFRGAVEWASKLDWDAIGGTLKTLGGVGRTILDTFLHMPSWVQVAVVSGWGLNKLTGGAVGTIVGQLASGLIKGVLGINAGVVNVRGGIVNSGGGVGGRGGGGMLAGGVLLAGGGATVGGGLMALDDLQRALAQGSKEGIKEGVLDFTGGFPGLIGNFVQETFFPQGPKVTSPQSSTPLGQYSTANRGGVPVKVVNAAEVSGGLGNEGERRAPAPERLGSTELIQRLAKITEMGLSKVGTSVQFGIKTGMDPFGRTALALFQQAKNPKAPAVLFEIREHIKGAEEVQRAYLKAGDRNSAREVQVTIDGLHRLIGTHDRHNALRTSESAQERARLDTVAARTAEARAAIGTGFQANNARLDVIAHKDFSPKVNVIANLAVDVFTSATSVMRSVRMQQSASATVSPGGSGFQPEYQG